MTTFLHHWFAQPWALWLLGLVPVLTLLKGLAQRRRRKALAVWGGTRERASGQNRWRILRGLLQTTGMTFFILGIAGPQWGHISDPATAPGRDTIVVLDLSRSMLAQDVLGQSSPNRLGRAKDAIMDVANYVQRRGGHRLALVIVAARAKVACPLTHDYDHFREALASANAGDPLLEIAAGGESSISGTRIGAALRQAVQLADERFRGHQEILLLSDGDDPAGDEEWRDGMTFAVHHKIPVYTVGIGDPEKGSSIPIAGDGYLMHDAEPVMTRLNENPLQEIARQTGGTYIPARTAPVSLGEIFRKHIEIRPGRGHTEDVLPVYRQHASWFFGTALMCFALEMIVGDRRRRRHAARPKDAINAMKEAA